MNQPDRPHPELYPSGSIEVDTDVLNGQTITFQAPPPNIVIPNVDGQPLVTIHPTGALTYGPGYEPDDAARQFWDALRAYATTDADARAGIDRVRQLHRPVEHRGRAICAECSGWGGSSTDNSPIAYEHCPTLKAITGETP